MAVKIIDNVSIVQAVPAVTSEIFRDVSKPLSFYLVGIGSGQWSATITLYEIDPIGYKKIGKDTSFNVTNNNPMELFTWSSNAKSFVVRVSSIKNASVTVYMTQAESSQLERILLTEPSSGTKAMPSDIVGCAAEYVPGQGWIGNLGVLDSKAVLDSFPTNALVPGKVWAVVASASSFAKYNYMSAGWALESSVGPTGSSNLPGSPSNPFTSTAERNAWAAANLGSLLAGGRTLRWTIDNGVPVEQAWAGPGAGDWVYPGYSQLADGFCATGISDSGTAFSGGTMCEQSATKIPFQVVRLLIRNYANAAMDVTLAKVAASPTEANNGAALSWVQVTFSGLATASVPAALGSNASTDTTIRPGVLLSDPVLIPYTARTDSGTSYLLLSRVLCGAGVGISGDTTIVQARGNATGISTLGIMRAEDHVTTPDAVNLASSQYQWWGHDVIFYGPSDSYSILDCGDSRAKGVGGTIATNLLGPVDIAMSLALADGVNLGAMNYGLGYRKSRYIYEQTSKMIQVMKPTFAKIWWESPNDGPTKFGLTESFARDLVAVCRQNRVLPIICTPTPINATGETLTNWIAAAAAARSFAAKQRIPVADYAVSLSNPSAYGTWAAAYLGDTIHTNNAGIAVMGADDYAACKEYGLF